MVEAGKELEFVMCRLRDISYLSDNARGTDPRDPHVVQRMLGDLARQAMPYLQVAMSAQPASPSDD